MSYTQWERVETGGTPRVFLWKCCKSFAAMGETKTLLLVKPFSFARWALFVVWGPCHELPGQLEVGQQHEEEEVSDPVLYFLGFEQAQEPVVELTQGQSHGLSLQLWRNAREICSLWTNCCVSGLHWEQQRKWRWFCDVLSPSESRERNRMEMSARAELLSASPVGLRTVFSWAELPFNTLLQSLIPICFSSWF